MQVLETGGEAQDDEEPQRLLVPRQRPSSVRGITDRIRTGHGTLFVTVNFDDRGRPFEVFSTSGKAGGCDAAHLDGLSRLISLALRSGIDPDQVVDQLRGTTCCPVWNGGTLIRSAEDAVAQVLSRHTEDEVQPQAGLEAAVSTESAAQLGLFPSTQPNGSNSNGHQSPSGAKCPGLLGFPRSTRRDA